jgi:hypothetical protein
MVPSGNSVRDPAFPEYAAIACIQHQYSTIE